MVILKSLSQVCCQSISVELSYTTVFPNSSIHLWKQWQHLLCLVFLLWGESNLCHLWKVLYSVAFPIFLVIFSATVYQEVTVCSLWLIGWKRCFIRICFMQYSSFVHKFNLNIWMKTCLDRQTDRHNAHTQHTTHTTDVITTGFSFNPCSHLQRQLRGLVVKRQR